MHPTGQNKPPAAGHLPPAPSSHPNKKPSTPQDAAAGRAHSAVYLAAYALEKSNQTATPGTRCRPAPSSVLQLEAHSAVYLAAYPLEKSNRQPWNPMQARSHAIQSTMPSRSSLFVWSRSAGGKAIAC